MSFGLERFEVNTATGFLPEKDPLQSLPAAFSAWDQIGREIPKLLVTFQVKKAVASLPELDPAGLQSRAEQERAMVILSFLGHAYVWGGYPPADTLPAQLARPWAALAKTLGRPPVLSYASYAIHNWKRITPDGPIAAGNVALLQNFYGGADEEWFVIIHVDIEAKAAGVVSSVATILPALQKGDSQELVSGLRTLDSTLSQMYSAMERMPELCDPYIYFNRVRPYIFGWKNQPSLPKGVVYEGVTDFQNVPQMFRGETGAQSGIIPVCDALLGVGHKEDPLRVYLNEMREYMPPKHRAFLEHVENESTLRAAIESGNYAGEIKDLYNSCVDWVDRFRTLHLDYAVKYIANQAQHNLANPSQVGTGGTPFVDYLKKHRDETSQHRV